MTPNTRPRAGDPEHLLSAFDLHKHWSHYSQPTIVPPSLRSFLLRWRTWLGVCLLVIASSFGSMLAVQWMMEPPRARIQQLQRLQAETNKGRDFVQQWHLNPAVHTLNARDVHQLYANPKDERWSRIPQPPLHPRNCSSPQTGYPSAHVLGPAPLPALQMYFTRKQLRAHGVPEAEIDKEIQLRVNRPALIFDGWHMQLTTHAIRYDIDSGSFSFLVTFTFAYEILPRELGAPYHFFYMRHKKGVIKLWEGLWRHVKIPFVCTAHNAATRLSTPPQSATLFRGDSDKQHSFEFRCPWAHAPSLPPENLEITLSLYEGTQANCLSIAKIPPLLHSRPSCSTTAHIHSTWDRRISAVYCKTLVDPHSATVLFDFIAHHAYLGFELFDFEDRYGIFEPVLRHWTTGPNSIVRYRAATEFIHFYEDDGQPTTMPLYYRQSLMAGDSCRYRHHLSAKYIATWDLDEWLLIHPNNRSNITKQYGATCLTSHPVVKTPVPWTIPSLPDHPAAYPVQREMAPVLRLDYSRADPLVAEADPNLAPLTGLHAGCRSLVADYLVYRSIRRDRRPVPIIELIFETMRRYVDSAPAQFEAYKTHLTPAETHVINYPVPTSLAAMIDVIRDECNAWASYRHHPMVRFQGVSPLQKTDISWKWMQRTQSPCGQFPHNVVGPCQEVNYQYGFGRETIDIAEVSHFSSLYTMRDADRDLANWTGPTQESIQQQRDWTYTFDQDMAALEA